MISSLEILETRIAPAILFVSATSLEVNDSSGASAEDTAAETEARVFAGSTVAVSLAKGDKLVFDTNHNLKSDKGDLTLLTVSKGSAIAFLTDLDGDGRFDPNEITGLAVSDGFGAKIGTDISGSIVTALKADGSLNVLHTDLLVTPGSIDWLTVQGAISGRLLAEGSISNVKIGSSLYGAQFLPSVEAIQTGSAAATGSISFSGPLKSLDLNRTGVMPGMDGGDITNISLANGAIQIRAGDGESGAPMLPDGGAGGSISGVTITQNVHPLEILAGNGGGGFGESSGGNGGAVSKVTITSKAQTGDIRIHAGAGGEIISGIGNSMAGKGGDVSAVKLDVAKLSGDFALLAGSGAMSGGTAASSDGGSVREVNLKIGSLTGTMQVVAGQGGSGGSSGNSGGNGGDLTGVTANIIDATGLLVVASGLGGSQGTPSSSGNGGDGGEIRDLKFASSGAILGDLMIVSGDGGNSAGGTGGTGGAIHDSSMRLGLTAGDVTVTAGTGGNGVSAGNGGMIDRFSIRAELMGNSVEIQGGDSGANQGTGTAGVAGDVRNVSIVADLVGEIEVRAGDGRDALQNGDGGEGGNLRDVDVRITKEVLGNVLLTAGKGGSGVESGAGGRGGSVSGLSLQAGKILEDVTIASGNGGNGGTAGAANGEGGAGGDLSKVKVVIQREVTGDLVLTAGAGGTGDLAGASHGGNVSGLSVKAGAAGVLGVAAGNGASSGTGGSLTGSTFVVGSVTEQVLLQAGSGAQGGDVADVRLSVNSGTLVGLGILGGDTTMGATEGTAAGAIRGVTLSIGSTAIVNEVRIAGGNGGTGGTFGIAGGAVEKLKIQNAGSVDVFGILGGTGGGSPTATAAAGGSVSGVVFSQSGAVGSLLQIQGGTGGSSPGGSGGSGGDVSNIAIRNTGTIDREGRVEIAGGAGGFGSGSTDGGEVREILIADKRGTGQFLVLGGNAGGLGVIGGGGSSTGGDITGVKLAAPLATVQIGSDTAGRGTSGGTDASGGSISGISGKAGYLTIIAGAGGSLSITPGVAGDGGDVTNVNVAVTHFVQQIRSGNGGNGSPISIGSGGSAGDIRDIKVRGDIGNFSAEFGVQPGAMGGLIAGKGGTGFGIGLPVAPAPSGDIEGVRATRIAAIYAGDNMTVASQLTMTNAVNSIAKIQAKVIGADRDGDGEFDFINAGDSANFDLGLGDTPIDGILIALSMDNVKPTPLKVVLPVL